MNTLTSPLARASARPARVVGDVTEFTSSQTLSGCAILDEVLVADSRAGMTPSQMVEHKLLSLLHGQSLPAQGLAAVTGYRPIRRP